MEAITNATRRHDKSSEEDEPAVIFKTARRCAGCGMKAGHGSRVAQFGQDMSAQGQDDSPSYLTLKSQMPEM